jgi:hypothetical protein
MQPAHGHRLPPQLRVLHLLDGGVEGVRVEVNDHGRTLRLMEIEVEL